jgi:flagellar hook-basal body complex protein FliE
MAYTNKRSVKRKHRKYRRRSKKGGVVTFVRKPNNSQAISRKKSPNKELNDAEKEALAADYTREALDNALSIFSRQEPAPAQAPAQAPAPAPLIGVTVYGKSKAKREGPTPGQIKKEQEKQEKALAKQLKETEKALAKQQKEAEKAAKKAAKEEEKAAKEVTRAGIDDAFSSMFGKKHKQMK